MVKRDNSVEKMDFSKIQKQTRPAVLGLGLDAKELEEEVKVSMQDMMTSTDMQSILIKTALSKVDVDRSKWTFAAARLDLYDLYHRIKISYNEQGSGDVYKRVTLKKYINMNKGRLSKWYKKYTKKEVSYFNSLIDGERDLLFDYLGFKTMTDRYLIKDNNSEYVELPQHMHMAVAMFICQKEHNKKYWVEKVYNAISTLLIVNATPINSNGRLKNASTASCLTTSIPDSINGIFDAYKEIALGSKLGAGWGIDITRIRALASTINNVKGVAGGSIPFSKILNDIAIAVDQLGKRPGAFALFMECWSIDIFDFIDLKKKNGDDRRRAQDLFLSISYNDLFMKREEEDGDWTLFDPYDTRDLTETWGNEFEEKYLSYEKEFMDHPERFNPNTKVIKARDLMRQHVISYVKEGQPFVMFKDTVNRRHKRPELGIVRNFNLCQEVYGPTDGTDIVTCNLGSLNLARIKSPSKLKEMVMILTRMLDNVIDVTEYSSKKSRKTQKKRRAIGIGCLGEAEMLANSKIKYGSKEHEATIVNIYKTIRITAEETSKALAIEKGGCYLEDQRNAYLMAVAPNSTSGLFAGTTNSHEPVYNKIWMEDNMLGSFKVTAPNLNVDNYVYYVNPYELDQKRLMDLTKIRQDEIDMGISHNIYIKPQGLKVSTVVDLLRHAWKIKLNTLYYFRAKPPKNNEVKTDEIACFGCNN